jgi:replicative DNA helicase
VPDRLPTNIDAERAILGAILLDESRYHDVSAALSPGDFSLSKHAMIFLRMDSLKDRGEHIDRLTLTSELSRSGELEAVGGLSYIVTLDDGLPETPHLDSYVRELKEKAALRRIIYTADVMSKMAMTDKENSRTILNSARDSLLGLGVEDRDGGPETPAQIIESMGGVSKLLGPQQYGLRTGFIKYDDMTGGLHPGEVTILAARPSVGKSAMAVNIAQFATLKNEKRVMLFSLEMSKEMLLRRMVCAAARVDSQRLRHGYITSEERRKLNSALADIADSKLLIDDHSAATPADVHARIRRQMSEDPIDLVIIDYLQLMSTGRTGENRNQEISQISRGIKLLSIELQMPILMLSQLSRAPEIRKGQNRPQLSDLRESGSIEQDADVVAFIFREEMYARDREDLRGLAELIIGKQRSGPTGTVNLVFLHSLTKFENRAEDTGEFDQGSL